MRHSRISSCLTLQFAAGPRDETKTITASLNGRPSSESIGILSLTVTSLHLPQRRTGSGMTINSRPSNLQGRGFFIIALAIRAWPKAMPPSFGGTLWCVKTEKPLRSSRSDVRSRNRVF